MRNAFALFLSMLLTVCLALYGPTGMARAGGDAAYSMVICADGAEKTVVFDSAGNPVDPTSNCPDCLTCCHAVDAPDVTDGPVACSLTGIVTVLAPLSAFTRVVQKRHIFPAPRGPPAVQEFTLIKTGVRPADAAEFDYITRGDGRSLFKDAIA